MKKFKAKPTGLFHIYIVVLPAEEGKLLVEAIPGHALASLEGMEPPEFLGLNHTLVRAADRVLGAMAGQQMQESAKEFLRWRAKQP
jgi:hypothetical protein